MLDRAKNKSEECQRGTLEYHSRYQSSDCLNYVRERGPISRGIIARETALQRSTVSLIVDELRVDGLVEEVSGESTGGRPPSLLSLRTADANRTTRSRRILIK